MSDNTRSRVKKLLQQRNDGYFGEYAGRPAVLQSAAEICTSCHSKRRYSQCSTTICPTRPQTIATFTRHQVGTVERALKVFLEFGLVEILTDGAYYMADIQLLIGQSSTEGERKKKERMRLKRQKLLPSGGADICPPYSRGDICPPEIRDKRLDIRDKSIENRESESARAYGRYQNVFLTDAELADLQASFPTVWGQYIEKLSEYMASTGKRYQEPCRPPSGAGR